MTAQQPRVREEQRAPHAARRPWRPEIGEASWELGDTSLLARTLAESPAVFRRTTT
jgi:hypothetical protein